MRLSTKNGCESFFFELENDPQKQMKIVKCKFFATRNIDQQPLKPGTFNKNSMFRSVISYIITVILVAIVNSRDNEMPITSMNTWVFIFQYI